MRQATLSAFGVNNGVGNILGSPATPSAAVAVTGLWLSAQWASRLSVAVTTAADGTVAGTYTVLGTNDVAGTPYNPSTFTPTHTYPIGQGNIAGNGTVSMPETEIAATYVQVNWLPSAGTTPTIQAMVHLASVGEA